MDMDDPMNWMLIVAITCGILWAGEPDLHDKLLNAAFPSQYQAASDYECATRPTLKGQ